MIRRFKTKYGLNKCLAALGVAKSSYYHHQRKVEKTGDEDMRQLILKIIKAHPAYGYRRIGAELRKRGVVINHKKLRRLLKAWGYSLMRKTKKVVPSGILKLLSELGALVNLAASIEIPKPFEAICGDITEIPYAKGKVYLAGHLDICSRRLIGHAISKSPNSKLVLAAAGGALRYLRKKRINPKDVIFHQDQGSVYTGYAYCKLILRSKAKLSYSRKATPSDNAWMESFFGRLKEEWGVTFANAQSESEVISLINQALLSYNRDRLHSSLDYQSPDEFIRQTLRAPTHSLAMT